MANIALLPPEQWEALRISSIRGSSDEQLARQFEVTRESIRMRRMRDPAWKAALAAKPTESIGNKENVTTNVTAAAIQASVADSLRQNGEQTSLRVSQIALRSVQSAPDTLPCETASDLKTFLSAARIAAGMDKAQPEVRVNVAMFQPTGDGLPDGIAWEAETVEAGSDEG